MGGAKCKSQWGDLIFYAPICLVSNYLFLAAMMGFDYVGKSEL